MGPKEDSMIWCFEIERRFVSLKITQLIHVHIALLRKHLYSYLTSIPIPTPLDRVLFVWILVFSLIVITDTKNPFSKFGGIINPLVLITTMNRFAFLISKLNSLHYITPCGIRPQLSFWVILLLSKAYSSNCFSNLSVIKDLLTLVRLQKRHLFLSQSRQMCRNGSKVLDKSAVVSSKTYKVPNLSHRTRPNPILNYFYLLGIYHHPFFQNHMS